MDLKVRLKSKKEKVKNYWSLVIEPGWVQAGIWNIREEKVNFVCYSPSVAWESEEELISSSDTALSSCIQKLPEEEEDPSDVVFGLPGFWTGDGNIKDEYLIKIKKICSDLSLKPAGFVILSEAIAHYVKINEGSPLTAVVIGVYKENIEVVVFRLGKMVGSTLVARSVSISDDVVEALSRLSTNENFPSRFVLFDSKEGDLEEIRQSLINTDWDGFENLKLLHTPKVESISPEKKVIATSLAGGLELANVDKMEVPEDVVEDKSKNKEFEEEPAELTEVKDIGAEDVGFVLGEDVTKVSENVEEKVDGEEIQENLPMQKEPIKPKVTFMSKIKKTVNAIFSPLFAKLKRNPSDEKTLASEVKKGGFWNKKLIIIPASVIFLLFVGGFFYWWYVPKAVVRIFVSPRKLEETVAIKVKEGAVGVDLASNVIPGKLESEDVKGEKTTSTTGTKTVGERAKGEVTIYRSGSELKLDAGTVLSTSGGLEFTLDDDATIASGSASSPGTTKVKVSADKIGAEYNLAADESFIVGNYPSSDLEAKNESSFSGGSSKEISVVSEDDQKKLEDELTQELIEKGIGKIKSNLSPDKYVVDESVETEILDRTYDKKLGDEATNLKLSLSLKVSVLVIDKKDLIDLARNILQNKVAEDYTLQDDQIKVKFDLLENDGKEHNLNAKFIANLLPKVDIDKIRKEISGKYPEIAKSYLSKVEGFEKIEVVRKPSLPGKLGTLPRIPKNISIEVEAF